MEDFTQFPALTKKFPTCVPEQTASEILLTASTTRDPLKCENFSSITDKPEICGRHSSAFGN